MSALCDLGNWYVEQGAVNSRRGAEEDQQSMLDWMSIPAVKSPIAAKTGFSVSTNDDLRTRVRSLHTLVYDLKAAKWCKEKKAVRHAVPLIQYSCLINVMFCGPALTYFCAFGQEVEEEEEDFSSFETFLDFACECPSVPLKQGDVYLFGR